MVEDLEKLNINPNHPKQVVYVGRALSKAFKLCLKGLLTTYRDTFAWKHANILGIDPRVITHKLSVDPSAKLVRQKKRAFATDMNQAIVEEVDKLLEARFIREVTYCDWIANLVLVRKSNGKWRMCVDFTDLNKACLKDSFPLPKIDSLVDSTSRHALLSFFNAFSDYNQIQINTDGKGRPRKNVLHHQSRHILLLGHVVRLKECWGDLSKIGKQSIWGLDRKKCWSLCGWHAAKKHGIQEAHWWSRRDTPHIDEISNEAQPNEVRLQSVSREVLGIHGFSQGIEANLEKVKAILGMKLSRTTKDVQRLAGRVATLSRFISRLIDKCFLFFGS